MGIHNLRKALTPSCFTGNVQPLFYLLILLLPIIQACTTIQAFPQRAYAGETVVVSVGTPNGMTKSNTTVRYTPAGGNPIDITGNVRAMFKLYPDPNSAVWNNDFDVKLVEPWTGHGAWTMVVAIDLPPTLPSGPGSIKFYTPASYPPLVDHLNTISISLEILSGGPVTPSTFDYSGLNGITAGELWRLEPLPRITVKAPDPTATYPLYGGVEVTLNVPNLEFFLNEGYISDENIRVIVDQKTTFSQENGGGHTWGRNGDEIKVMFVSPAGKLQFTDIYFSVLPNMASATITQLNYYDISGNPVNGPTLTVTTGDIN